MTKKAAQNAQILPKRAQRQLRLWFQREMMLSADTNDNGTIEFNEFLEVMSKHVVETDLETDLRMAFR